MDQTGEPDLAMMQAFRAAEKSAASSCSFLWGSGFFHSKVRAVFDFFFLFVVFVSYYVFFWEVFIWGGKSCLPFAESMSLEILSWGRHWRFWPLSPALLVKRK